MTDLSPPSPQPTGVRLFFHRITRRAGCFALFVLWLFFMLLPCTFVTLLVNRELTYDYSDLPEHQLRLFLMDNKDERGFGLSRPSIEAGGEDEDFYCMATKVDYLLWEGSVPDIRYCDCYEKNDGEWSLATMSEADGSCRPPE